MFDGEMRRTRGKERSLSASLNSIVLYAREALFDYSPSDVGTSQMRPCEYVCFASGDNGDVVIRLEPGYIGV
jgi:hypothetical protein